MAKAMKIGKVALVANTEVILRNIANGTNEVNVTAIKLTLVNGAASSVLNIYAKKTVDDVAVKVLLGTTGTVAGSATGSLSINDNNSVVILSRHSAGASSIVAEATKAGDLHYMISEQ